MNRKVTTAPSTRARALLERSQSAQGRLTNYIGLCHDMADKSVGDAMLQRAVSIKESLYRAEATLSRAMKNKTVSNEACYEFEVALEEALTQASGLQGFDEELV